jgi:hypothetical protein
MKRLLALLTSFLVLASAYAGDVKVEAIIAVDGDTKPATSFTSDTPKLFAFFRSKGTETGDKLRGVWIAEDVGDAAPANTKIDEATVTADKDDFHGAFSLSKPTKGWPIGRYKVEIYDEDELITTVKFTITAAK